LNYQIQQLIYDKNKIVKKEPIKITPSQKNTAIIIHVFYIDVWEEILKYLEQLKINYDLYITIPPGMDDNDIINMIKDKPDVTVYMTENRGRDVLPFLQVMNIIGTQTYQYICKLHTKKTGDSALGNVWRKLLYFDLLGSNKIVKNILNLFKNDSDIGIITGKNTILDSERYDYGNTEKIDRLLEKSGLVVPKEYLFAGGTMFWIRSELLVPIMDLYQNDTLDFEEEKGQKDNTLAHAIERFFGIICQVKNKKIVESPALYSKASDQTLNEVAALVLSQQYVGNDVFISQRQQIQDFRSTIKFKEKELELKDQQVQDLEELAQSLRLKNRLKKLIKSILSVPKNMLNVLKTIQNNPAVLKKVFYYLKRGEISYLLSKTKEKSGKNLVEAIKLTKIDPNKYFKKFDAKNYLLNDITIDIIIPVYNGYEFLNPLFDSIEKNTISQYRLIVVNDCSPDERVKPLLLKRLEKHPSAIFIDHKINEGFVKSVNEAYSNTSNHFLILNTDTEVPAFWMERLMYPIVHMDKIASTTPFTNSGQIASFPNFIADNEIFEGMSVDALDSVFRNIDPKDFYEEVPTGVGFCMGVNYSLIQEIGFFVEEEFGKGYGEENDWCQRAIQNGYKNLMVPNLFVYHKHGGSFSAEEKESLMKENAIKLLNKHPNYDKDVEAYVRKDPHRTLRQIVTIVAASQQGGVHLVLDQALGGGANHYTKDLVEQYLQDGKKVIQVHYDFYANAYKFYFDYKEYHFSFSIATLEILEAFFKKIKFQEIFVNNLVSFQETYQTLSFIEKLVHDNNAKLVIPIHDYYPICPNYTLLNEEGEYCGIPSLERCQQCMQLNDLEWKTFFNDPVDMKEWREKWAVLLALSNKILCFSNSSKELLLSAYHDLDEKKIEIIPHQVDPLQTVIVDQKTDKQDIVIGVLGAINHAKGGGVLKELVRTIEQRNLNIKVVLIGEISENIKSDHFYVTGRYQREELPKLVAKYEIDIFLLPSICPETFSYTTQEIMMMDMPLMVFNIGAPAERVVNYSKGYIINKVSSEAVLETIEQFQSKKVH